MIPALLLRASASIARLDSAAVGDCVRAHREERLAQALAGLQVPLPPRSLAVLSAASGGILRSRLMVCFFLLSVADLLLTGWLLGSDGPLFEANPLAAWCLEEFGWAGLAGLKATSFLLAAGGVAVLACRRPRMAQGTLALGCMAVALVVLYSASLVAAAPALREQHKRERACEAREEAQARRLAGRLERRRAYDELRRRLSRELLAGRRSLESAVAELERLGVHRHPDWRSWFAGRHPEKSPQEVLERQLLGQLLADIEDGAPEGQRLLARLWPLKLSGWGHRSRHYGVPRRPVKPASCPR